MQESVYIWIKPLLNKGKSLVYFASGTYINPEYNRLKYSNIILVDNEFRQNSYNGKNIFCLKMDCIEAVYLFKRLNVIINCFVGLNEGLYEGGGKYAINSDCFLGYCFPILADKLMHIGYPDYYQGFNYAHVRKNYLNLPYEEKEVIDNKDTDYVSPSVFSWWGSKAIVTVLNRKSKKEMNFQIKDIRITIKHDSIWSEIKNIDAAFVKYENNFQKEKVESLENKAYAIKDYQHSVGILSILTVRKYDGGFDIDGILNLTIKSQWVRIGIVPNLWDLSSLFSRIESMQFVHLKEIIFYHLNKNDYSELYKKDGKK